MSEIKNTNSISNRDGKFLDLDIQSDFSLKNYNTLAVASKAQKFIRLEQLKDLNTVFKHAIQYNLPIIPLGEGSNVLLAEYLKALILKLDTKGVSVLSETDGYVELRVAAGENWHDLVMHTISNGWYGLENLALIPGSVGAAPIQNIGAYGVEVSSFVTHVHIVDLPSKGQNGSYKTDLQERVLANRDCQFNYRNSIFKQSLLDTVIITHVDFKLAKVFKPNLNYPSLLNYLLKDYKLFEQAKENSESNNQFIEQRSKELLTLGLTAQKVAEAVSDIRRSKLPNPAVLPNAGSFFKNIVLDRTSLDQFLQSHPKAPWFKQKETSDYKIPAAWLIEQCGFKGQKQGSIGMHDQQALVLVNHATTLHQTQATACSEDILAFAEKIIGAVKNRFGLQLDIEPRILNG